MSELKVIEMQIDDVVVKQRCSDGYIDGLALCETHGRSLRRLLQDYRTVIHKRRLALSVDVSLYNLEDEDDDHYWLHPLLAAYIAAVISPTLASQVFGFFVFESKHQEQESTPKPVGDLDSLRQQFEEVKAATKEFRQYLDQLSRSSRSSQRS